MKMTNKLNSIGHPGKVSLVAALCAACVLTACGGGGTDPIQTVTASRSGERETERKNDDITKSSDDVAAANKTMILSRGTVSAVGILGLNNGLQVNNTQFNNQGAVVRIRGLDKLTSDLRLGMVVEVEGERNNSSDVTTARTITADSFAEGRVQAIDPVKLQVTLQGIVINVSNSTVFEGLTGLNDPTFIVGDFIEVYGLATGTAGATATRIEKKADVRISEDASITGAVTSLDTEKRTFTLHGRSVNYAAAKTERVGAGLANGSNVRVEGVTDANGVLVASEIHGTDINTESREGFHVEQEGVVSGYVSIENFIVNGVTVNAKNAAVEGTIGNGVRVEVKGTITGKVLIATKVESKDDVKVEDSGGEVRVTGPIKLAGANGFTMGERMITWSGSTRFDDMTPQTLRDGLVVEVKAVASGPLFIATRIKLED